MILLSEFEFFAGQTLLVPDVSGNATFIGFHMCDFSSICSQILHFSFFCFMVPRNCFCDNNPIDVIVLKLKKKLCIGNTEKVFLGLCKWALTVIIMSTHTPIHHRRMHSLNYTNAHKQRERKKRVPLYNAEKKGVR